MTIKIKFEGIDYWSRPVFKSVETESRYGSTEILFHEHATEEDVLKKISEKDLLYFGNSFDCEPMGDLPPNIEIIRKKFGCDISKLKDVTDMIYDTLVKNNQYPQFPISKLTEQFTNAEDGYINIRLGENTYHINITKDEN